LIPTQPQTAFASASLDRTTGQVGQILDVFLAPHEALVCNDVVQRQHRHVAGLTFNCDSVPKSFLKRDTTEALDDIDARADECQVAKLAPQICRSGSTSRSVFRRWIDH
jgi:hypothetical protein